MTAHGWITRPGPGNDLVLISRLLLDSYAHRPSSQSDLVKPWGPRSQTARGKQANQTTSAYSVRNRWQAWCSRVPSHPHRSQSGSLAQTSSASDSTAREQRILSPQLFQMSFFYLHLPLVQWSHQQLCLDCCRNNNSFLNCISAPLWQHSHTCFSCFSSHSGSFSWRHLCQSKTTIDINTRERKSELQVVYDFFFFQKIFICKWITNKSVTTAKHNNIY